MENAVDKFMIESLLNAKGIDHTGIISPDEYLKEYFGLSTIHAYEVYYIYQKILSLFPFQSKNVILHLISFYLKSDASYNDTILKYLKENSIEEVIKHFSDDYSFACPIIYGYFAYLKNPQYEYYDEIKKLLFKYDQDYKITFINDYIRYLAKDILVKINNFYTASTFITATFYDNMQISADEELLQLANEIKKYHNLLSRLIYADIYEDIMARANSNTIITQTVLMAIDEKDYLLPLEDFNKTKMLIIYFLFLNSVNERRYQNRLLLNEKSMQKLKEVNPLFIYEDSDIIETR